MADMTEQSDFERKKITEENEQRAHDLTALYDLIADINLSSGRSEIYESLKRYLIQQFQISAGAIYLISPGKNYLLLEKHWGWAGEDPDVVSRFSVDTWPYQEVIQQKKAIPIKEVRKIENYASILMRGFDWAVLSIPMLVRGGIFGVFDLFFPKYTEFQPGVIALFSILGQQVGMALQNASLSDQVRAGRDRLKAIAQRDLDVQEAERRHIARELHDVIGQALTALKVNLQGIQYTAEANRIENQLRDSIGIIDRTLQQVRDLSLDLRPSLLDDLGVVSAIRWYLDHQAQRAGFEAQFLADPPEIRLYPELETTCFRVVQEAITNVIRHAQATTVRVELRQDQEMLILTIRDDGVGFDVRAAKMRGGGDPSLGLFSMEERVQLMGGQIEVHSDTTQQLGTMIRCIFPMKPPSVYQEKREKRKERE
jgi:signal transduction histidine kinase